MKLMRKVINIVLNVALILTCFNGIVFASEDALASVNETLVEVTQVLLIVAGGVCIGKLIHIGILYVTSSAVEKSNAKMALVPWLIGTFLCFGAAVIGPAIISIFEVSTSVLDY